jgi:hypothetical protein
MHPTLSCNNINSNQLLIGLAQACQSTSSVTSSYNLQLPFIPALWFHYEGPLALLVYYSDTSSDELLNGALPHMNIIHKPPGAEIII